MEMTPEGDLTVSGQTREALEELSRTGESAQHSANPGKVSHVSGSSKKSGGLEVHFEKLNLTRCQR